MQQQPLFFSDYKASPPNVACAILDQLKPGDCRNALAYLLNKGKGLSWVAAWCRPTDRQKVQNQVLVNQLLAQLLINPGKKTKVSDLEHSIKAVNQIFALGKDREVQHQVITGVLDVIKLKRQPN